MILEETATLSEIGRLEDPVFLLEDRANKLPHTLIVVHNKDGWFYIQDGGGTIPWRRFLRWDN